MGEHRTKTSDLKSSVLWSAFEDVRRQGVPLGLSEYLVVVDALRKGYSVENYESLKRFCRLVWAKSTGDLALVDQSLTKIVEPWLAQRPKEEAPSSVLSKSKPKESPPVDLDPRQQRKQTTKEINEKDKPDGSKKDTFQEWPLGQMGITQEWHGLPQPAQSYQIVPRWPVSQRELVTTWRVLRRPRRDGPVVEWDVEETISQVAQTGRFLGPIYRPLKRNQLRLVILIDQGKSMVPFQPVVAHLMHSIRFAGFQGRAETWFFENSPGPVVYAESHLVDPQPVRTVLSEQDQDFGVVIIGDAGATQRLRSAARIKDTHVALSVIRSKQSKLVWLNPIPQDRWRETTAEQVARHVPMFPWSKRGMRNLVDYVRGTRRVQPGVGYV